VQSVPHEIPAGLDVAVPLPVPALTMVSTNCFGAKLAVTEIALSIVTVHVPVTGQPPPVHPVNTESAAGAAVNVTGVCAA
jgi:hypothetical protein